MNPLSSDNGGYGSQLEVYNPNASAFIPSLLPTYWKLTKARIGDTGYNYYFTFIKHTTHENTNGDCKCDICELPMHTDRNKDCKCDRCGTDVHNYASISDPYPNNPCLCLQCEKVLHVLTEFAAKEPTCTEKGNPFYRYCSKCGYYYLTNKYDYFFIEKNVDYALSAPSLPATGHDTNPTHVPAAPSTCEEPGHVEHWHCSKCNLNFADSALQTPIADVSLPLAPHQLTIHHPATRPTCTQPATEEYWQCSVCKALFADKDGKQPFVPGTVEGALGHSWAKTWTTNSQAHWKVCLNGCVGHPRL